MLLPDAGPAGKHYTRAVLAQLRRLEPRPSARIVHLPLDNDGDDIEQWLGEVVPEQWTPEQCVVELQRLAAAEPVVDLEGVTDPEPPKPRVKLTRAADVVCRPVEWLWRDRVPLGMLSLFAGDPKLGKSFVTLGLAAAESRGAPHPGGEPPAGPGSVVILSAEDDPSRTIVPRLKSAGADLTRVHILESVYREDGSEALPSLRLDIAAIEEAVARLGDCRLVIVDPVSAYLGGTDDHKNGDLRGVLSPLKAMAERTGAAVVLVTHLNKGAGTNGVHRVTGSIAYVGACRANFLFVRDRDDPSGRRVLMLPNGCNLAAGVPTLAYQVCDRGDGPVVEWEAEPVRVTVEEALGAQAEAPEVREERMDCDTWLREVLADGPVPGAELAAAAREAGFSLTAVKRSKVRIGARTRRDGFGQGSKCYWMLDRAAEVSRADAP